MPPPPPPPPSNRPGSQPSPGSQQQPSRTYMVPTGDAGNGISQPIVSQYALSTHDRRGFVMSPDRRNFMHSMNFEAAHRVVGQSVGPDVSKRFAYTFAHEHYDPVKKPPRGKLNWLRGEGVPPPPLPLEDRPQHHPHHRSSPRYEYPEEYERPRPSSRSRTHHREQDDSAVGDDHRPRRDDDRGYVRGRGYEREEHYDERRDDRREDRRSSTRGYSRGRTGTPPPTAVEAEGRRGTPIATRDDRPSRRVEEPPSRYAEADERGAAAPATSSSRARYEERSSRHDDRWSRRDEERGATSSRARSPRAGY